RAGARGPEAARPTHPPRPANRRGAKRGREEADPPSAKDRGEQRQLVRPAITHPRACAERRDLENVDGRAILDLEREYQPVVRLELIVVQPRQHDPSLHLGPLADDGVDAQHDGSIEDRLEDVIYPLWMRSNVDHSITIRQQM